MTADLLSTISPLGAANTDLSALVGNAHWIVKGVMLILAAMFLVCLYITIYKVMFLTRATQETTRFGESFWKSRDIEQIYQRAQGLTAAPFRRCLPPATPSWPRSPRRPDAQAIARATSTISPLAASRPNRGDHALESMVPFLATTGRRRRSSASLARSWALCCRFRKLDAPATPRCRASGPHIAEALLATAIGLVAAIPAVMAYNFFARRIKVMRAEMDSFEQDYLNIIKRHFLA
jgi:biopolymer transport protein TolQ